MAWPLAKGRPEERFSPAKPPLTPAAAVREANRCLKCHDAPCIAACPTGIDVPEFIRRIGNGDVRGAGRKILEANILGQSCARVCPVEVLCVGACVHRMGEEAPIEIGRLQRHACDAWLQDPDPFAPPPLDRGTVVCVGAGPASLACAVELVQRGIRSVVLEKRSVPGGLNTWGVAPYKQTAPEALEEIEWIESLGVEIRCGVGVAPEDAPSLLGEYDAVFLGLGLGADRALDLPGAEGIHGATTLIETVKMGGTPALDDVTDAVVIGGGNTAVDAARELAGLGVDRVTLAYRGSPDGLRAYAFELEGAGADGVHIACGFVPTSFETADGHVAAVLAEDGRRLAARMVVLAIGQDRAASVALAFDGVEAEDDGRLRVDPSTGATGHPRVYAGGDCVNGGREVVHAVAEGARAGRALAAIILGAGDHG